MALRLLSSCVSILSCGALLCCGSGLRLAPRGPHPAAAGAQPVAVDSAPPPARIDEVRAAPRSECSWADGQWRFVDNRWQWEPGGWVQVPDGCYYADALVLWVPTPNGPGLLFYTEGQWYTADAKVCKPTRC